MTEIQTSLRRNFTLEDKVKLCHSRIPMMRYIEGWLQVDLIAPLPIWSPVPEKYRRSARDDFSVWGLEAQHPKYLPAVLQPFVRIEKRGSGERCLTLLEGAYRHSFVFSFNGFADSKDLEKFQRARMGHYDEENDVITVYLDTVAKTMTDDYGHIFVIPSICHGEHREPLIGQNPENLADVLCSVITHECIHRTLWLLGLQEECRKYDHHAFYEKVECDEAEP
jgi:hypothetical protein